MGSNSKSIKKGTKSQPTTLLKTDEWVFYQIQDLFELRKGKRLTKANMKEGLTPFVGSIDSNNGISATVGQPAIHQGNTITVSYNGSVAEAFYQLDPFWASDDVNVLYPLFKMTPEIALFICTIIRQEKYRFNYGRKWHLDRMKISKIKLPAKDTGTPDWKFMADYIKFLPCSDHAGAKNPVTHSPPAELVVQSWKSFQLQVLFDISRGLGPRQKNLGLLGKTPFVTSTESNNGVTGFTRENPTHLGNTIGVNRNGSVAEAFYQPVPFCSTEDVHIFTPKFELNAYIAMFLATLIRKEKYRFGYGRKWGIQRMKISTISLPVTKFEEIDWQFMEDYIKTLPYSSSI